MRAVLFCSLVSSALLAGLSEAVTLRNTSLAESAIPIAHPCQSVDSSSHDNNFSSLAQTEQNMIADIMKLKRPTVICNGGNPADHKSKIMFVDTHNDSYVLHRHDGHGNEQKEVTSGHHHHGPDTMDDMAGGGVGGHLGSLAKNLMGLKGLF